VPRGSYSGYRPEIANLLLTTGPGRLADAARLSPLKDRHVNFPGRYRFSIRDDEGSGKDLRPMRDPKDTDEE
jgi:hypothetical protein